MSDCDRPLPEKLSQWIRVAIEDVKVLQATPGFTIDLSHFYRPTEANGCMVCLGGAALVRSCNLGPDEEARFDHIFTGPLHHAAAALDCIRLGNINAARRYWKSAHGLIPRVERTGHSHVALMGDIGDEGFAVLEADAAFLESIGE